MTHRVHPYIFRIGETNIWRSRWFNLKKFPAQLREDTLLREWLRKKLTAAHIAAIEIERSPNRMNIILKTARPGILIGRGGEGIQNLKKDIEAKLRELTSKIRADQAASPLASELKLTVEEVRSPETDAAIVAQLVREDIEKRVRFRRLLKQTVDKVMTHKEVKGVKVMISGRLDGAEMSRTEWLKAGRIPLQTIRANVDYAATDAFTTYGVIGVKVWIYKGDVFAKSEARNSKS